VAGGGARRPAGDHRSQPRQCRCGRPRYIRSQRAAAERRRVRGILECDAHEGHGDGRRRVRSAHRPVHAEFVAGRLRTTIYENALRRRDLRHNPQVALTTWGAHGAAAIVYGSAREVPGSLRDTRPGASGRPRRTVTLEIDITRIYAMGPRES
jgi:hypothetical protein